MDERFNKEDAALMREILNEMFEAIPKSKRMNYLGHPNDALLFVSDAERAATRERRSD